MSKDDFINEANVDDSIAEKAWTVADGNKNKAQELLKVESFFVKGEFISSSEPVTGFFLLEFDPEKQSVTSIRSLVLNSDDVEDLSVTMDWEEFDKTLERLRSSDHKMNANTEQLNELLATPWKESSSDIRSALDSQNIDKLQSLHHTLLTEEFDFKIADLTLNLETKRAIEDKSVSHETDQEEEEEVELPCDVEITPTRGIPVAKLSSGDEIFLTIGDVDRSDQNIKRRLEATKDQETGMVTGTLVSKESSEAGTMNLRVKFGDNVYGHASCGKDVSLRVPERTLDRYGSGGNDDYLKFIQENWIAVTTGVIVTILFLSLVVVLTGI